MRFLLDCLPQLEQKSMELVEELQPLQRPLIPTFYPLN
jgi:hypothetical protein